MSGPGARSTEEEFLGWVLRYLLSADTRHELPFRAAPGWNALDSVSFRRIFLSKEAPLTELVVLFSFASVPTAVVGYAKRVAIYLDKAESGAGPQAFSPAQRAALAFCKQFLKALPDTMSEMLAETYEIHWMDPESRP